jgi:hypothetical protein
VLACVLARDRFCRLDLPRCGLHKSFGNYPEDHLVNAVAGYL